MEILSLLDGVRENGGDNYMSRCPAHEDRSPSLSIKICGDGRILLHCFAGCEVEAILDAIDLKFSDVMPERIGSDHSYRSVRRRPPARDALIAMDHAALVVAIIGADMIENGELNTATWDLLAEAVGKINTARAVCAPLALSRRH